MLCTLDGWAWEPFLLLNYPYKIEGERAPTKTRLRH